MSDGTKPAGEPAEAVREFIRAWDQREFARRAHQEADDRVEAAEAGALDVFRANGSPAQIQDYLGTVRLNFWDGGPHLDVIRPLMSYELKPAPRPDPADAEVDEAAAYAALEDCGLAPPDADALASVLAAGMATPGPDGPRPPEDGDSRS